MVGGAFLKKPSWSLLALPGGGVTVGQVGKYGIVAVASAITGASILGAKQMLDQKSEQKAQTGSFIVYAQPGSQVTLQEPKTGSIEQKSEQQASQTQPDYMQYLLIGGLILGAIYLFKKR